MPNLTMPLAEPGMADIVVDGQTVGHALGRYGDWAAWLWLNAGHRSYRGPLFEPQVVCGSLRALRAELRRRLAEQGPWWT